MVEFSRAFTSALSFLLQAATTHQDVLSMSASKEFYDDPGLQQKVQGIENQVTARLAHKPAELFDRVYSDCLSSFWPAIMTENAHPAHKNAAAHIKAFRARLQKASEGATQPPSSIDIHACLEMAKVTVHAMSDLRPSNIISIESTDPPPEYVSHVDEFLLSCVFVWLLSAATQGHKAVVTYGPPSCDVFEFVVVAPLPQRLGEMTEMLREHGIMLSRSADTSIVRISKTKQLLQT